MRRGTKNRKREVWRRNTFGGVLLVIAVASFLLGCGPGSTTAPASPISIDVAPKSASLFLGQTQTFTATVGGNTNTAVTWEVNGIAGGNSTLGEISAAGVYMAPAVMPAAASITITSVSVADISSAASASVSLKDDIAITILPPSATIPAGAVQIFSAAMSASGSPAGGVSWSVSGIAGGNTTVGTIVAGSANTAAYTAPAVPPSPASVTITAASVADATKIANAIVTVTCPATTSILPPSANVSLGNVQVFSASFCLAPGATVAWDVNGVAGGNSSLGTIVATGAATANYTAPADLPASGSIVIHATASAVLSGSGMASAPVTIVSNVRVLVTPASAGVPVSQRISLAANVSGTSDADVSWSVNGVPNGNATVGEICVAASNPCAAPSGPVAGAVDFLAPANAPDNNPVTVVATSRADSTRSGSASVTVGGPAGPVSVSVTPPYVFLPPSNSQPDTQQFNATVTGSANSGVNCTVQSAVTGQGCAGSGCGSINSAGLYTAPTSAPSPNAILVTATSQADPTKSGVASVVITSGPTIEQILPSSVMAGAVEGFPFAVHGVNFVAGSGGTGSVILFNGAPRATTCASAGVCMTALNPPDVATAQTTVVEIQNPGTASAISNAVPLVIAPFDISTGTISLTAGASVTNGKDLVVTEATTAAASSPINVQFVGMLTSGNCGIQGSPLTVTRPASGVETASICVDGNGLDSTFTYAFTGPASAPGGADIAVTASPISGLFPGMIELDLQISASTLPGLRSLWITTPNLDRAVATGMLEVR